MRSGSPSCPRDRTPLRRGTHEGHELLGCPTCLGVWLDPTELSQLCAPLGHDLAAPQVWREPPLSCPIGAETMGRWHTKLADVEIDVCPLHGGWLDRNELSLINATVARLRGVPARGLPAPPTAGVGAGLVVSAIGCAAVIAADPIAQQQAQNHWAIHGVDAADVALTTNAIAIDAVGGVAEGAAEVGVEVGSGALEAAGGILEAIGEFLAGLAS